MTDDFNTDDLMSEEEPDETIDEMNEKLDDTDDEYDY